MKSHRVNQMKDQTRKQNKFQAISGRIAKFTTRNRARSPRSFLKPGLLIFLIVGLASASVPRDKASTRVVKANLQTIEQQLGFLLQEHQQYLTKFYQESGVRLTAFDRGFYANTHFFRQPMVRNFLRNVQANFIRVKNSGKAAYPGLMRSSFTTYTNINGRVTGTQIQYFSDGRQVRLVKAALNPQGKLLRTIYTYNPGEKELGVRDYRGKQLVLDKKHLIDI